MRPLRRTSVAVAVSCGAGLLIGACMMPSDHSGSLQVVVTNAPSLMRVRDSVRLSASLQDASGSVVAGAALRFRSDNDQVVRVDSTGLAQAMGVGQANVVISSAAFAGAQSFTRAVRVVDVLAIDSVRPRSVLFGQIVQVYGLGLDSVTGVTLGGADAFVAGFTATDPAHPHFYGVLSFWAPPPAPSSSFVTVERGGALKKDTTHISVGKVDIYEPNDTLPVSLGTLKDSIYNPALALEQRRARRNQTYDTLPPSDWYTFQTTTTQDVSVTLRFPSQPAAVTVAIADSLYSYNYPTYTSQGTALWRPVQRSYLGTPEVGSCAPYAAFGQYWSVDYSSAGYAQDSVVVAYRSLPAGLHHLLILYGSYSRYYLDPYYYLWYVQSNAYDPLVPYELLIKPGYKAALSPDQYAGNGTCYGATALTFPANLSATIDHPGQTEWFKFTVSTQHTFQLQVDGTVDTADIDLAIVRDLRVDSLQLMNVGYQGFSATPHETVTVTLPPGNYFAVVADYGGVPTTYSMKAVITAAPPAQPAPAVQPLPERKLRELRARMQGVRDAPMPRRMPLGGRP